MTFPMPGPSRLPFRVAADQDSAATAQTPSGAAPLEASVGAAFPGAPLAPVLFDSLFAEPMSYWVGDRLAGEPLSSAW
jgi:hypothetical protein